MLAKRSRDDALQQGARKKPYVFFKALFSLIKLKDHRVLSDPLVHHGRHFGRAIFAFANVRTLISNGLNRLGDEDLLDLEELPARYDV